MYLGETVEEKKESYKLLTDRAKKLGRFFGLLGGMAGIVLGLCLMFAAADNKITAIVFGLLVMVLTPVTYYWMGYLWFYGFMTVKSWFVKLGIGVLDTSVAIGDTIAVSYLLGSRKAARITGIVWIIAFIITLMIGFYVGLYNFFKIRAEVKSLGIG